MTLRFIGTVNAQIADDIAESLTDVCAHAFTISLKGVGSFYRMDRIEMLWAGVNRCRTLMTLHQKIDQGLGWAAPPISRRPYRPHITVARFSRPAGPIDDFVAQNAGLTSEEFPVSAFSLFESTLSPGGARYRAVASYPLVE